jgi:penicillin-binding protein 1B
MKKLFFILLLVLLFTGASYVLKNLTILDEQISSRFEGRRWELPARIYGRPLELYVGKELQKEHLQQELNLLQYKQTEELEKPGAYNKNENVFTIHSRNVHSSGNMQPATIVELIFENNVIISLIDLQSGQQIGLFQLEPLLFASIYPGDNEDRLLIQLKNTPSLLRKTLLLVEDKQFYHHLGVRPLAIFRALLANLKAGKTVQGGSTLTQQLVKNFFLSGEQSMSRKLKEACMALLLEYRYQKDEILEVYLNEIYMGQDGKRAIHGFAMASRFYFERNLDELSPEQIALLVGLAKGASFYNPRKQPQRSKERRNLILRNMGQEGLLTLEVASQLQDKNLGVSKRIPSGITRYPAFVQLVRHQLKRDYRDEDLQSEGLSIFTTFDPVLQQQAEESVQQVLAELEKERRLPKETLQGAFVLCSADQGEVLAVVGDRFSRQAGFNRALHMKRPVGSVIKPAVYLNALSHPEKYNLLSTLYDIPLTVPLTGKDWQPENYDKLFHGPVPLRQALVQSLNVATVQLGMDLGVGSVIDTLRGLGVTEDIQSFPSLLLGAVELPPITILQMYQTIAAGGYKTPLRTILAVTDHQNRLLQRYPLTVEQGVDPAAVFCLSTALQAVCETGTGKKLKIMLPARLTVAGKTGTTDNLRDSWFAGFTGSHVAVVWVGRDDNKSSSFTGSSGAMRVWADTMKRITTTSLQLQPPENIDLYFSDIQAGKLFSDQCRQGDLVPFIRGGLLPAVISCQAIKHTQQNTRQNNKSLENVFQDGLQQFLRIFK